MSPSIRLLIGVCLGSVLATNVFAARALLARIVLLEGRVEIGTGMLDDGKADRDRVWQYLKTLDFPASSGNAQGFFQLQPDTDNPLQATLKGKIRVSIEYGGQAETTTLRLIRQARDSTHWRIHPDDVDTLEKKRR